MQCKTVLIGGLALYFIAGLQAQEKQADPTGIWKFEAAGRRKLEGIIQLKLEGDRVIGTFHDLSLKGVDRTGRRPVIAISDGKLKGTDISFKVISEHGMFLDITKYQGKVSGNSIKGTYVAESYNAIHSPSRDEDRKDWRSEFGRVPANFTGSLDWGATFSGVIDTNTFASIVADATRPMPNFVDTPRPKATDSVRTMPVPPPGATPLPGSQPQATGGGPTYTVNCEVCGLLGRTTDYQYARSTADAHTHFANYLEVLNEGARARKHITVVTEK